MVKSNEFKGTDLAEAVRKATAAYDRKPIIEVKSFCRDLRLEYDSKKQELDRIHDRIVDLQREADGLKRQATAEQLASLATAAALTAKALGNAARIVKFLRSFRLDGATLRSLQRNAPEGVTALTAAGIALAGQVALEQARELGRTIDQLKARYERIANDMMDVADSFTRGNSHLGSAMS